MERHWKLAIPAIVAVLVAIALGACAPAVPAEETPPPAEEEATAPPAEEAAEEITLVVWDQFQRDTERKIIDELNAQFEAEHPGVKIERVVKTFDDLKATLKLAMASPDGPDVSQPNQGVADMGAMVKADLLLDLTPYISQYGWDKLYSPSVLARNSFSADGEKFGEGNLYGVSATAEIVGVYYNKEKFEKLGMQVPKTFDEFVAILDKAKEAGETPIVFGNLDQWPGIHAFSAVQHLLVGREYLDDFVYGRNNVKFDTPENVEAAHITQEWAEKGYFTDGFAGIGYDDSWKLFANGEGVMLITGSWLSGDIVATGGEKFGFFLLPPMKEGGKFMAIGGVGLPFSINAATQNPDVAAAYLDKMVSKEAVHKWYELGVLPAVHLDEMEKQEGTLLADIAAAYDYANANNAIGHYIDWASPNMYDVLAAAVQELMAKQITPEEFAAKVQTEYGAYLKSK